MTSLIKIAFRHRNFINFTECKRFAGHSKWANIRHTKMLKDSEKSAALRAYLNKMRIAIAEGKSTKPEDNIKLARLVEQAKKNSMPMATIKNFLDKMQNSKVATQSHVLESRGPSGCVVLIQLLTDNLGHTKNGLNNHLKKSCFSPAEMPTHSMYEQKGFIYAEVENRDIDNVIDDAIEAGAEEAEKVKEDDKEFLQFTCHSSVAYKVKSKLEELKYNIISIEIEYIPKVYVTLKDEEMEVVSKLYDKLSKVEEVIKIYNNIS